VPRSVTEARERFFATAQAVGLNNLHEGGQSDHPAHVEEFRQQVGAALAGVDVEWIQGERFAAALAPDLGCRLLSVRETASQTDRLTFSTNSAQTAGVPAYSEVFFPNLGVDTPFARDPQTGDYTADLPNGFHVSRNVSALPTGFQMVSRVTNGKQDQPLQASGRLLLARSGEVRATGAFGERPVPALAAGSPAHLALTPAEWADQPVTFTSAGGTAVTVAVQGPVAGLSAGPGPDGLLSVGIAWAVPLLKSQESTQWATSVTFSGETGGAKPGLPGAIECQDLVMGCYREGELSGRRFEPTASDGRLSYIIGSTNEWALQWQYPVAQFEPGRPYDVLAAVRVLANETRVTGAGMTYGVYNDSHRAYKASRQLDDEACQPGQWQWIKVGTVTPEGGDFIWFAPTRNPTVKEIQVDRMLLAPVDEGG
jgi:hypothetical protein